MKSKKKLKSLYKKFNEKLEFLKVYKFFRNTCLRLRINIERSIRFELMLVIGICFLISFTFYNFTDVLLKKEYHNPEVFYDYESTEKEANMLLNELERNENLEISDSKEIEEILNSPIYNNSKVYITNTDGKVIFKTSNVYEETIDIYSVFRDIISNENNTSNAARERVHIMPLKVGDSRLYLIYSKVPKAEIVYNTVEMSNSSLALSLTLIIFIISFVVITNNKMKYLDEIAGGLKIIANGNLNYRIEEKGRDEIRKIANNINNMAKEIGEKIQAEREAEKTKTDLITNVSHDLRTPLTSIMGYIGLVKEGRYQNKEEMNEYLGIAHNKAQKLNLLIEDLFEYTKLNNNAIKFCKEKVNLCELLSQLIDEMTPILDENSIIMNKKFDVDKAYVLIDVVKMLRVFENLIMNAIKYSIKPGKIIVGLYQKDDYITFVCRNNGEHISKEKLDKVFDRFYRVDESRNTTTGGTGLGLAICKNIINLHEGKIWAECIGDNISFYVKLKLENLE
ncbi:sensor histidine kinase [Clostridium taeniosporum]|uniref:histidine kinase n=1 Tax=Clostridium taeniosporum TaxID=394958 RepID=A0A1D7XM66_9CLOT|nr:HAMP domain-containing sensor histidine kinase [Clostridium taeniosporum]AOR24426.1 sensor histidine kinase [Clostridium taeniosporum]